LEITEMSSSVKGDYSNAGSKIVLTTRDDRMYIDAMSVLGWPRHVTGVHIHKVRQADDEKTWEQNLRELSSTSSSFIRLIEILIQYDQPGRPVFSLPNPIANQPLLSQSSRSHSNLLTLV
jgi:hypothetical protein